MKQQDMRITGMSRCPYCGSCSYQVTYTIRCGALDVEGECLRCLTLGRSFRYQPTKRANDHHARVTAVDL